MEEERKTERKNADTAKKGFVTPENKALVDKAETELEALSVAVTDAYKDLWALENKFGIWRGSYNPSSAVRTKHRKELDAKQKIINAREREFNKALKLAKEALLA